MNPVIFLPDAKAEMISAGKYYQSQSSGLGNDFLKAINLAIQIIQKAPERWAIIHHEIRNYLVKKFPFKIFYQNFPDYLLIVAITHNKRDPNYWKKRLVNIP